MSETAALQSAKVERKYERPTRISVVVPVKNNMATVAGQLRALAAQDFDGEYEVIISDNGSTDGTREFLDEVERAGDMSLCWIDSSQRAGECHARNRGIEAAKYEFIACCDADDEVSVGWLSALSEAAMTADVIGGSLDKSSLNDRTVSSWRPAPDVDRLVVCGNFLPYAQGCNMGFWKAAWEAIGGYDDALVAGGGDIEFCWHAQTSGLVLGYAPRAVVAYRFRTSLSESWKQVTNYGRGQAKVVAQYRHLGASRQPVLYLVAWIFAIVITSPVFPWSWSRAQIGAWIWCTGGLWGCLSGGFHEGFLYF
jgi:glycosyltransferase involved in cell wall biosynthesis